MTEQEAIMKAKTQIKVDHAAYMREWRRQNPERVKASRERSKLNKINRVKNEILGKVAPLENDSVETELFNWVCLKEGEIYLVGKVDSETFVFTPCYEIKQMIVAQETLKFLRHRRSHFTTKFFEELVSDGIEIKEL